MLEQAFRAAIVDLDGTLVDTLGDFEVALNRMLLDLDLPPVNRELVARTVGKGSEHLIRSVLAHQLSRQEIGECQETRPASEVDRLYALAWSAYQRHYKAINGEFSVVYPGVVEGLQALREAGLLLACLTNKPQAFAQDLLAIKSLAGHFDLVFGGDNFERKKPDPLPVLRTCEALRATASETLMVGDSMNDAQAAHAAGCRVVLVTYGYNHGQPVRDIPALGWVRSLAEIVALLPTG